jgi:tight adherence protein B
MMLSLSAVGIAVALVMASVALFGTLLSGAQSFQNSLTTMARGSLADLFIFVDPRRLWMVSFAAVVVIPIVLFLLTSNPLLAAIAALTIIFGPQLAYRVLRKRRLDRLSRQLPDGLASLAGALRAGLSLPQALASLAEQQPAPLAQEFELIVRKQRLGMPLDRAIADLEQRVPTGEIAMFVTAMRIARELGGNLSESLERLAETLRRKLAMEDKIGALTSQGKIQGWIVGLLPVFLAGVLTAMEPEAMHPLFHTPIGWLVLGVIGALEFVGFILIRKIVSIEV